MPAHDAARQALNDALNGDRDKVDPAVRRGLIALAGELDDLRNVVTRGFDKQDAQSASLRRAVGIASSSVATAFFAAAAALISRVI